MIPSQTTKSKAGLVKSSATLKTPNLAFGSGQANVNGSFGMKRASMTGLITTTQAPHGPGAIVNISNEEQKLRKNASDFPLSSFLVVQNNLVGNGKPGELKDYKFMGGSKESTSKHVRQSSNKMTTQSLNSSQ